MAVPLLHRVPAADQAIHARGAPFYLTQKPSGNVTKAIAILLLGCFSHGVEDRSSPYHAYGGFDTAKAAVEADTASPPSVTRTKLRCGLASAGAARSGSRTEPSTEGFGAPGYAPIVLGNTAAAAAAAVGARMEALAAGSREIAARPETGYLAEDLQDPGWWLGNSSAVTTATMAETGKQSTRLVADHCMGG